MECDLLVRDFSHVGPQDGPGTYDAQGIRTEPYGHSAFYTCCWKTQGIGSGYELNYLWPSVPFHFLPAFGRLSGRVNREIFTIDPATGVITAHSVIDAFFNDGRTKTTSK